MIAVLVVVFISITAGVIDTGNNGGGVDFEFMVFGTGSSAGGGGFALTVFLATPATIERRRRLLVSLAHSMGGDCNSVATLVSEYRIRLIRLCRWSSDSGECIFESLLSGNWSGDHDRLCS